MGVESGSFYNIDVVVFSIIHSLRVIWLSSFYNVVYFIIMVLKVHLGV